MHNGMNSSKMKLVSGQLHAPAALPADKTLMSIKQEVRFVGHHSRRGYFVERKSLTPTGNRTADHPSRNIATILTALSS